MTTYQDFEKAVDKKKFIKKAIDEYQKSDAYGIARIAQSYYARKNEAILRRLSYLERGGAKMNAMFHKLCSGFFPKFVKQLSQYLLGNGVTLDKSIKDKLGAKFDKALQSMGIFALVDGVCWGFWNNDKLIPFRATEFFALLDERTSEPKVGIRFWQIDDEKPMYIEVYEKGGVTTFRVDKDKPMEEEKAKQAYKQMVRRDALGEKVIGVANYETLPIVPLWANELKQATTAFAEHFMADSSIFDRITGGFTSAELGIAGASTNFNFNNTFQPSHAITAADARYIEQYIATQTQIAMRQRGLL